MLERLGPEAYSSQVSERVYAMLAGQASVAVRQGHSAIADAVYARPADRLGIERAAAGASVSFVGLWLDAPESTLIARIDQRRNDASDADAAVIRMERAQQTGTIEWYRLDASLPAELVVQTAIAHLRERLPNVMNTAAGKAR